MPIEKFSFHDWLNDLETNVDDYISHPKYRQKALDFVHRMRNKYGHKFK